MNRKILSFSGLVLSALLLSGCAMRTVEEMYALPKRSEEYSQLQSAMDAAMVGLDYSAPISGENQQSVQTADLDGDGMDEYLVFASGSWENPLQVLIFKQQTDGTCDLVDIIDSNGTAFEQVEYVPFDDKEGLEIILGCQVSDQVLRSVSAYSMEDGKVRQLLLVGYSRFLTWDLDGDKRHELVVTRPGEQETDPASSVVYHSAGGQIHRSEEALLSAASSRIRRVQTGNLSDGAPAVLVSSAGDAGRILTDVLVMNQSAFTNITAPAAGDGPFPAKEIYGYPEDIDMDGTVELPVRHPIRPVSVWRNDHQQSLLRWIALDVGGAQTDKLFTFHNFQRGWYLTLDSSWSERISVVQGEDAFTFYMWNQDYSEAAALFTIFTFTGSNRNQEATADGRFLIHSTEAAVFAGKLEADAPAYAITRDVIMESFRLIRQDRRM